MPREDNFIVLLWRTKKRKEDIHWKHKVKHLPNPQIRGKKKKKSKNKFRSYIRTTKPSTGKMERWLRNLTLKFKRNVLYLYSTEYNSSCISSMRKKLKVKKDRELLLRARLRYILKYCFLGFLFKILLCGYFLMGWKCIY